MMLKLQSANPGARKVLSQCQDRDDNTQLHDLKPDLTAETSPAELEEFINNKLTKAAQKESFIEYNPDKPRPKQILKAGDTKIQGRGQVNVYNN